MPAEPVPAGTPSSEFRNWDTEGEGLEGGGGDEVLLTGRNMYHSHMHGIV